MTTNLDAIEQWVEERKAAYIADLDKVVYFDSHSGRKSDYAWISLSLTAMARVISTTKLPPNQGVDHRDCLTIFQEQERVFERAVYSRSPTAPHIFNHTAEADVDIVDEVIRLMMSIFELNHKVAMTYVDVTKIFDSCLSGLGLPSMSARKRNTAFESVLTDTSYWLRIDRHRVWFNEKKIQVVMKHSARPADIVELEVQEIRTMAKAVVGALK